VEQVAGMFDVPFGEDSGFGVQGSAGADSGATESGKPKAESGGGGSGVVRHELTAEVPGVEEPWRIGAIVGPSGSGKTTLAKAAFGSIYKPRAWPKDRALIDCLGVGDSGRGAGGGESGQLDIKVLTRLLVAVGLGSPP